jgi:hypothetical protein
MGLLPGGMKMCTHSKRTTRSVEGGEIPRRGRRRECAVAGSRKKWDWQGTDRPSPCDTRQFASRFAGEERVGCLELTLSGQCCWATWVK